MKWLDKYQTKGEVTPEKTYGTYRLPEVVVRPQQDNGFWKQSIRAFLDENRDAGLLGALGSVVTYPLGLPQQAMMYGLTGKVQRPSTAMGITNPVGSFLTDAIADPTNLVGAGLADDAFRLSNRAGKFLTQKTPLKNAYKLFPENTFQGYSRLNNPNSSYRVAGFDAAEDFKNTGVLRSNPTIIPVDFESGVLPARTTAFPSFQKGYADLSYLPEEGGVVFKTDLPTYRRGELNPVTGNKIKGRHYAHRVIDPETGNTVTSIPGENISMFEGTPNWLKGYKQIDAPVNSATPQPSFSTPYIPKTASELENTGYLKDKFYHKDLFETKKAQALERLSTPAGQQRLQNFIDDNYKLNPDNFGNQVSNPFSWIMNGFRNSKKFTPEQFKNKIKEMEFETPKKYVVNGRDRTGKPVYDLVADNNYQNNAYHWYRDGLNKPSYMTIGEGNTPYDALHVFEHELGHLMQRDEVSNIDNLLSNVTLKEQKTPTVNSFKSSESIIEPGYSTTKNDPAMTSFQGNLDYFKTGTFGKEKYPFAAELRENMLQRGLIKSYDDTITPELVQQHADLYSKTAGNKYMLRLYDLMDSNPENFKTISSALNKMPALVPAGVATAAVASQLPEKKKGGVITDPRGQWAHPGKVTRIPSNQITMQGVPYNVLGISDTGDTQMMYPDQDYSFQGSSVTEYPMMSKGGQKDQSIVCSNCGWSWKQSNAGSDPMSCHKCGGKSTGQLMMYQGGELEKYQKAGQTGGPTKKRMSFDQWYPSVPQSKSDTTSYNLRRAYELAPQNQLDAFVNNPEAHLYSVYPNNKGVYEFMKSKNHPTVGKELEWFNSSDPEAIAFRNKYSLDSTQNYYKYVPKKKSGGQHGGLDRWFAEKWVDVKTGKPCGRQQGEDRDYPACRPSKRVSAATPKTASELSASEKAKFKRTKQSSARIPYQHKKQYGGENWLDMYN